MNRLLSLTRGGKGIAPIIQRRSIMTNNIVKNNGRTLDSKIRDREMGLEDEYVRRIEKDRLAPKQNFSTASTQPKNNKKSKTDKMVLNNKVGGKIGRLSDSGIIF